MMNGSDQPKHHPDFSGTDAFKMKTEKSQRIQRRLRSYLLKLRRFDERVRLRDLLAAGRFEIEGASVNLRVPVGPAKSRPAPALESGQPDPFPARRAPIRPFLLRLLRRRLRRRSHRRRDFLRRRYLQFS